MPHINAPRIKMNTFETSKSKRCESDLAVYSSNQNPVFPKSAFRSAHTITVE